MHVRWLFIFSLFLVACNSNEASRLLRQQPFASLTDSIEDAPDNAGLYNRRGALLLEHEHDALAEKDFRKSFVLQPTEDNAIASARFLIGRNNDSAVAFLKTAVAKIPNSLVLQVSLARGFQQQKAYTEALSVCNNIITAYPNQLDALLLKASLLKEMSKMTEAMATMEQAYYYAPFDAELVHTLAFDYAQAKNKRALALADSLLAADSLQRHAEPYYFKGVYYAAVGEQQKALVQFEEAIRHDYNFLDAHMEKGVLQFESKQYGAAQKTFELALTIAPAYAPAYFWLGKIAAAQNKTKEARELYLRAYSLDKTFTEAKDAAAALKG